MDLEKAERTQKIIETVRIFLLLALVGLIMWGMARGAQ